jgi:hypothetical protein
MPSGRRYWEEIDRAIERKRLRLNIAALEFVLFEEADWSAETHQVARELEAKRAGRR